MRAYKPAALAGFAGTTVGGKRYRDVVDPTDARYRYRQFADGSILILASPRGGVGTLVTRDGPTANYWIAISRAIGTYPNAAATIASTALTVIDTAARNAIERRRTPVPAYVDPGYPPPEPAAPGLPLPLILGGVAALGLVLLLSTRGS